MTEDYGIPVWGSYLIFAIATIIVGLLIGLVSVNYFQCIAVITLVLGRCLHRTSATLKPSGTSANRSQQFADVDVGKK